jgi:hypothetical protein
MQRMLIITGLALLPGLAEAQDTSSLSSYQGQQYNYGTKSVAFADAKNASGNANLNLWKRVDDYQKNWVTVKDERELWLARNQIYDNVISLRSKDKIQQYLDEQRNKLGVGDLQGYQRMGEYNPYDGRSYIRYYDKDTGQLKISEVRGFREDLDRQRQDIEKHRERLAHSGKEVDDNYSTAIDAYNKADTARQDLDKAANDLAAARDRYQREQAAASSGGGAPDNIGGGGGATSGAPYQLKYPSRVGGVMRVRVEGSYPSLEQAMAAGRQLQSTTNFNVLVIDASGNEAGDP